MATDEAAVNIVQITNEHGVSGESNTIDLTRALYHVSKVKYWEMPQKQRLLKHLLTKVTWCSSCCHSEAQIYNSLC